MKIYWTADEGWCNSTTLDEAVPLANDMVDDVLSDPKWEQWIPTGLKKEALAIQTEEVKYRLVSTSNSGSSYVHFKGFKGFKGGRK